MDRLAEGEIDAGQSSLIREDLALWRETIILGDQLVRDLHDIAAKTFFGATP